MPPLPNESNLPSNPRILVRGVNWLGDAVMTTPALRRLRERHPTAHIALLTPDKLAGLWEGHRALDEVLSFSESESAPRIASRLRPQGFDVGLLFPNSFRSGLELWLARVPRRIGYAGQLRTALLTDPVTRSRDAIRMRKGSPREIRRLVGSTEVPSHRSRAEEISSRAHHLHQYLRLTAQLGASELPTPPELHVNPDEIGPLFARLGISEDASRPLLAINAGAEYGPAKRWPIERFVAAALQVQRQINCRWVILGGKGDTGIASEVITGLSQGSTTKASGNPAFNVAGKTSLRELCVLLRACEVLLTNDTGPMHVAAAVGTPVVVPFGSTSPELTGPGMPGDPRHRLLRASAPCAPCFLRECPIDFRCMRGIPVDAIVAAVLDVLRSQGGQGSRRRESAAWSLDI